MLKRWNSIFLVTSLLGLAVCAPRPIPAPPQFTAETEEPEVLPGYLRSTVRDQEKHEEELGRLSGREDLVPSVSLPDSLSPEARYGMIRLAEQLLTFVVDHGSDGGFVVCHGRRLCRWWRRRRLSLQP
jgi:hypothetical protein